MIVTTGARSTIASIEVVRQQETFDISIIDSSSWLPLMLSQTSSTTLNSIPIKRLVLERLQRTHHEEFLNDFSWLTFNYVLRLSKLVMPFSIFKFFW